MMWNLTFISEEDFTNHVKATIEKYGEKLESFDLKRFNKNIIDSIKLIFDKTVYQSSWEEIVSNEIFRQRDKSNNNDIGYFHQRIFQYIKNCHVPPNGEEGGWDVIYENPDGIPIPDAGIVHTVYVEMKNKHNTMNSASAGKTLTEQQTVSVLKKFRKEAESNADMARKMGRECDSVSFESEASILSKYIPSTMSFDEVYNTLKTCITKDMNKGQAMKVAMPMLRSKAEGKDISTAVDKILSE